MNRKVEIEGKDGADKEKHIQVARTLAQAAELNENMEETKRKLNDMMEKFCNNIEFEK